ncbi:MAG: hypothetical protein L0H55_07605 [Candidatus Nitrosocosmicus sp.]|nr:hypothetical protein [Candidatus Nitrosocosmicus sp.]
MLSFDIIGAIDLYLAIVVTYLLLQFLMIFALSKNDLFKTPDRVYNWIRRLVIVVQITLSGIVGSIIFEILLFSQYHTILASITIGLSYLFSILLLGFVVKKFIHWYNMNRLNNNLILYAISTVALLTNFVISFLFFELVSFNWNPINPTAVGQNYIYIPAGSFLEFLFNAQLVTTVISFALLWYTTFKSLFHFLTKGRVHFILILLLPMLFFVFQYLLEYNSFLRNYILTLSFFERNLYFLGLTITKPIGGLLFGIIFIILSKRIPKQFHLHDYLILTSLGLFILFTTNQAAMVSMFPYPPFGLVSVAFLFLGTYFYLIGITFSVRSISENNELRNTIKKITKESDIRFLDEISSADILSRIEQDVLKKVDKVDKKNTGIHSVDESELKQYVLDVLNELKK